PIRREAVLFSFEVLKVDAGSDTAFCNGSVQLGGSPTYNGNTYTNVDYSWSPSTGLSATNVANPIASPTVTTTYTVEVSQNGMCLGSDKVVVTVTSSILFPLHSPGDSIEQAHGIATDGIGNFYVSG